MVTSRSRTTRKPAPSRAGCCGPVGKAMAHDELIRQSAGLTIGELLLSRARQHPDRLAIVDGDRQFTFGAFNARVNQSVHVLQDLDIGRGDRVAILSENRVEYLEL